LRYIDSMSDPATQQSQNDSSDLPVGEILRRTRIHYNRSIDDVEAALRIQAKQIHAIETGDTETLPARVYAIGFVRSYAEYLGLDGDKIVSLFKTQSSGAMKSTKDLKETNPVPPPSKTPPVTLVVGLLVLACGAMIALMSMNNDKPAQTEQAISETQIDNSDQVAQAADNEDIDEDMIPEVPEELKVATLAKKPEPKPEPAPEPEPVVEKQEGIVLKMVQNSWVEIRDQNNRKLISRVLDAGDQYFVPDRLGLSISIGNAGGVEILVDGVALEDLGKEGQVLRRIPLNAATLKARFPSKAQKPVESGVENE